MSWQGIFTCLLIIGVLPHGTYEALSYLTLGGYFVGNVAQHVLEKK